MFNIFFVMDCAHRLNITLVVLSQSNKHSWNWILVYLKWFQDYKKLTFRAKWRLFHDITFLDKVGSSCVTFICETRGEKCFKGPLYGLNYSKGFLRNNTAILYLLPNRNSSEVLSGGWSEVAVTVYEEPAGLHPWWWDGSGQDLPG